MSSRASNPRPEREQTDLSLREERDRTDHHLAKRNDRVEAEADVVVEQARDRADQLVDLAHQAADAALERSDTPRELEDGPARASALEAVAEERAAADRMLELERIEQRRAMARLLALERGRTDERLLSERTSADEAVASRDEFLGIVSHDVRGLLFGMAMSAELLQQLPDGAESVERARVEARRIRRLTSQMNRLLGDLLDVVSMESGMLAIVPLEEDAAPLVSETVEAFRDLAAARKVGLAWDAPDGSFRGRFDHDRLLQVLSNLVVNALKYTDEGGRITLMLGRDGADVRFAVRDDGCGIAAEHLDAIFERFSQTSRDRRGLGLGLYIARSIVEAHGGRIWAESVLGGGSTFHFTVPASG